MSKTFPAHSVATPILGVRHTPIDFEVPDGACDCHVHVFGPQDLYPYWDGRRFTPGQASADELLDHQKALHLQRVIIVQPSAYGPDNRCTLDAVMHLGKCVRGVAVIGETTSPADLADMHESGVRGVRVNLETWSQNDPAVARGKLAHAVESVAPLGWHVQIYASRGLVAALHPLLLELPVELVIDHFGCIRAEDGFDQPGLAEVLDLLRRNKTYVKMSSPQRRSSLSDFEDMQPIVRAMIEANPDRLLWGSDWPHTGMRHGIDRLMEDLEPFHPVDDGKALNLMNRWVADASILRTILVDNPARLYGF